MTTLTADHRRRLTILADWLEAHAEEIAPKFRMAQWFGRGDPHDCGTAACAAGWATRIPELQADGLYVAVTPLGFPRILYGNHHYTSSSLDGFFGVWGPFDPMQYARRPITPAHVVARIRSILAEAQ